jgi:ornithine carbamoyltransferase
MYQLGGQALFLSAQDIQLRRGETVGDTARTLERYLDGIMIRTFAQADVDDLARYGSIPVINGLTDLLHPTQALADIMTMDALWTRRQARCRHRSRRGGFRR